MKPFRHTSMILALTAPTFLACAGDDLPQGPGDNGKADDYGQSATCQPDELNLFRDERPVDGQLTEVKLLQQSDGLFELSLRTAFFDFFTADTTDVTETLASGLACSFGEETLCLRDELGSDGALVELSIRADGSGNFDVELDSAIFDHESAEIVTTNTSLGRGLASRVPTVFSFDARPVDGTLKELRLTPSDHGFFDASLRTAFFDRINGIEVDDTVTIATALSCSFGDEIHCVRDELGSDGARVELSVIEDDRGRHDLTLETLSFDLEADDLVSTLEELAAGLERQTICGLLVEEELPQIHECGAQVVCAPGFEEVDCQCVEAGIACELEIALVCPLDQIDGCLSGDTDTHLCVSS